MYITLHMRDLINREKGREEGLKEGKALLILQVLKKNGNVEQVADFLGIPAQEVSDIAQKYGVSL